MTAHISVHPRRRGSASITAGLLAVVLSAGVALSSVESASASTKPNIVGNWRAVSVAGYDGALTSPPLLVSPTLRFTAKGTLSGSDGCNYLNGSYRLGRDGAAKFQVSSTKRLCFVPNPPSPVFNAVKVKIRDGRLVFYAKGGNELATYARVKATKPK